MTRAAPTTPAPDTPAPRPRLPRSLTARLSAVYLVLLLAAGAGTLWLTWTFAAQFVREVDQRTNRPLAQALAQDLSPHLAETLGTPAGRAAVRHVQTLHPALDLYLLDADGRVVRAFVQKGEPARARVDLAPVRAFLAPAARLPILGDDPGAPEGHEVFSAAEVTYGGGEPGYLYAVLRGMRHMIAADAVRESYVVRTFVAALAVVLGLAVAGGLVLFALITRPFRRLTATVERFRAGDFAVRAPEGDRGEIGMLGHTFNGMADRIESHLAALDAADEARRALAENVAHDFRNLLAPTRASAERLLRAGEKASPEKRREGLLAILASTGRLGLLADQLALLSDLDARRVVPRPERFSAAELAQDVVLRFRPDARRRGVRLMGETTGTLMPLHADIALVERALSNLIENALRHTPRGGEVRVGVEHCDVCVRLVVRDTGAGIAADELALVTRRFYRSPASLARGASGSGLGLAITRELVELHGGTLDIESRLGEGTSVALAFPVRAEAGTQAAVEGGDAG